MNINTQMIVHTEIDSCVHGGTREECSFAEELYICGYVKPNYPVPAIPDNHAYLARKLGTIPVKEWLELWEWSSSI